MSRLSRLIKGAVVAAIVAALGTAAHAALLGVQGTNRLPRTKYTGTVAYDAGTGNFLVDGTLTTTDLGGANGLYVHPASPNSLQISMRILDATGSTYEGTAPHALYMNGAMDLNRNGIIEAGESGVLLTGDLIEFGFANAPPGRGDDSFEFRFKTTGGLLAALYQGQNIGAYARIDPNNNWTSANTSFNGVIINSGVQPMKCGVAIGDVVWHDVNANGRQDAGEPGINGVTVRLKNDQGAVVATTVTGVGPMSQTGYYQFSELVGFCAGTWTVEVDLATVPAGFVPTTVSAPGSNNTNDSNPNPSTVVLATDITKDFTHDFGFRTGCDGRIGNFVWHDLDRNGIQDAGEPGLDSVKVSLRDPNDNSLLATTTTSSGGAYQFTGLCAGNYVVEIDDTTLPAGGFTPTTSTVAGSTLENDSNGSPTTVTLATNHSDDQTNDFGYLTPCTGSIGNFVWYDVNQNGLQDAGEPGIDGVTVQLVDALTSAVLATTTTGSNGYYQFTGLCGNDYLVKVDDSTLPPGRTPTSVNAGAADVDSNVNPAPVALPDSGSDQTIDFGYLAPCTGKIGDFVWKDENRNGIQDAGEVGFENVTVNLHRASDNAVVQTDITGADGGYLFSGLCPGSYIVEAVPPAGSTASPAQQGGDAAKDSNLNLWLVTLPLDSSSDLSVDYGFYCTGSLGDFVWEDANGNGLQDAGEPGLAGVAVTMTDAHGHTFGATTDANGRYVFNYLCAGTYTVSAATPTNYVATVTLVGANRAVDSNTNPTSTTLPANNSTDLTLDFGFKKNLPPPVPDIRIIKSANKHTVVFGESVTYTYVVTNTGNVTLTDVVVTDDNATPTYKADDFTVGAAPSLAAGASVTFTAVRVPPAKMCNNDYWGKPRKCGMMITEHQGSYTKFTYLQSKDHRNDYENSYGWSGRRSYSHKGKFRVSDYNDISSQDVQGSVVDLGDDDEYANAFVASVGKSYVSGGDGGVKMPKVFHKSGWDGDWHDDWDSRYNDSSRYGRWDDDKYDRDNNQDYDYNKHPKQCATTSTNIAVVKAKYGLTTVTASDKETVQIVAPTPSAPYKTFTQGGWGAKPSGNNPGKFLADNFSTVYTDGFVLTGGTKTIKLTGAYYVEKFLPQGGTPARLTQNYVNPNYQITVLAGQVLALKLNVDFSKKGVTRTGLGNLTVVSGELEGKTVNEVLSIGNSVLGGGALPSGLSLSELNDVISKINENFDGGSQNNGYLVD